MPGSANPVPGDMTSPPSIGSNGHHESSVSDALPPEQRHLSDWTSSSLRVASSLFAVDPQRQAVSTSGFCPASGFATRATEIAEKFFGVETPSTTITTGSRESKSPFDAGNLPQSLAERTVASGISRQPRTPAVSERSVSWEEWTEVALDHERRIANHLRHTRRSWSSFDATQAHKDLRSLLAGSIDHWSKLPSRVSGVWTLQPHARAYEADVAMGSAFMCSSSSTDLHRWEQYMIPCLSPLDPEWVEKVGPLARVPLILTLAYCFGRCLDQTNSCFDEAFYTKWKDPSVAIAKLASNVGVSEALCEMPSV